MQKQGYWPVLWSRIDVGHPDRITRLTVGPGHPGVRRLPVEVRKVVEALIRRAVQIHLVLLDR